MYKILILISLFFIISSLSFGQELKVIDLKNQKVDNVDVVTRDSASVESISKEQMDEIQKALKNYKKSKKEQDDYLKELMDEE